MNITSSMFAKNAWSIFLYSKKLAQLNNFQYVDSEHLLLSILENSKLIRKILEKNGLNINQLKQTLNLLIDKKGKMNNKQENIYIGNNLHKTFLN